MDERGEVNNLEKHADYDQGVGDSDRKFTQIQEKSHALLLEKAEDMNDRATNVFNQYIDGVSDGLPEAILYHESESPGALGIGAVSFPYHYRYFFLPQTKEIYIYYPKQEDSTFNPYSEDFAGFDKLRTLEGRFQDLDEFAKGENQAVTGFGPFWKRPTVFRSNIIQFIRNNFNVKNEAEQTTLLFQFEETLSKFDKQINKLKEEQGELKLNALFDLVDKVSGIVGFDNLPEYIQGESSDYNYLFLPKDKRFVHIAYSHEDGTQEDEGSNTKETMEEIIDDFFKFSEEMDELKKKGLLEEKKPDLSKIVDATMIEVYDNIGMFSYYLQKRLMPGYEEHEKAGREKEKTQTLKDYRSQNTDAIQRGGWLESFRRFLGRRKDN